MEIRKVYISGRITGLPKAEYEALFNTAAPKTTDERMRQQADQDLREYYASQPKHRSTL